MSAAMLLFPQTTRLPLQQSSLASFIPCVDIATPEFSLALRHSSGRCRCKLWPQNENLIFGNDFNARGNLRDLKRAKLRLPKKSVRPATSTISAMAMLMEGAR